MKDGLAGPQGKSFGQAFLSEWLPVLIFAAIYWLTVRAGLLFLLGPEGGTAAWPASGLALAALLWVANKDRLQYVVAIGAASFLAHFTGGHTAAAALGFAAANVAEAALGWWTFCRIAGRQKGFSTIREVQGLFAAAVLANGLTALFGATVSHFASGVPYWIAWRLWWAAGGLGMVLVAPFLISWSAFRGGIAPSTPPRLIEGAAISLLTLASILSIFRIWPIEIPLLNHPYALFLLALLMAVRFGARGLSALSFLILLFTFGNFTLGNPMIPFGVPLWGDVTQPGTLLRMQVYLSLLSAIGLSVAALVSGIRENKRLLQREKEELRESEERYRELVEKSSDIVIRADSSGHFTFMNPAGIRLFGYRKEEILGRHYPTLIRPDMREEAMRSFGIQFVKGVQKSYFEYPFIMNDGSEVWLGMNLTLIVQNGHTVGFQAEARDITARKRDREELQRSRDIAERLAQEMAIIAEIGKVVGSTLEIEAVYERFAFETQKLIPFDRLAVNLHGLHQENAKVAYVSGERVTGRCQGDLFPFKGSTCEVLTRTRAGLCRHLKNDAEMDSPFRDPTPSVKAGMRSLLRVPLFYRDEVIGSLHFGSKTPDKYTDREFHLAERIGMQIAGAVANAELYAGLRMMQQELKKSEQRYRELSMVDELTQLYNSRHFYVQLKSEIERSNRYGQPLTLLLLDIDNFKSFNDVYGHVEGDRVLLRLGRVVKRCLRETDSAYRYGGEEFTILLPMATGVEGLVTAERIRTEFRKEAFAPSPGLEIFVTVSIGLAQYEPQEEMKAFVHRADRLMYQGKKNGKDRICFES